MQLLRRRLGGSVGLHMFIRPGPPQQSFEVDDGDNIVVISPYSIISVFASDSARYRSLQIVQR